VVALDPNRAKWGPNARAGRRGGVATVDGRVVQAHGLSEVHTAELERASRTQRLQERIMQTKLMLQRAYHNAFDREPPPTRVDLKSDSSTTLPKAAHVPRLKVGDDHV